MEECSTYNFIVYLTTLSIIRIIKPRRMRWAVHVARVGEERSGTRVGHWWESQREGDHWEDQDVGGWILGWILERWDGVMWTGLVWLRIGTGGELL
jgi:hypothetical protein